MYSTIYIATYVCTYIFVYNSIELKQERDYTVVGVHSFCVVI